MSPFGLKFSQMILHTETSKLMYNWSFLFEVLHKPTLLPSTFNQRCKSICEKMSGIIWNAWKDRPVLFNAFKTELKALKWGFEKIKKAEIRLKSELSQPCLKAM